MHGRTLIVVSLASLAATGAAVFHSPASRQGNGNGSAFTLSPAARRELDQAAAKIDAVEASTLTEMRNTWNPMSTYDRMVKLGRVLLYDRHLSVDNNTACTFCHTEDTGFTGPSSAVNQTVVAYPGSVRSRHSQRRPQSYSYAPFAPVLHYYQGSGDFVGGNFWDMRATGNRLANPSAEQAQDPPTDPNEMGFRDSACVVYRMSQQPYRPYFESVWGANAFQIQWPGDVEQVCNTVWDGTGENCSGTSGGTACLQLGPADRSMADRTYDAFGAAIAVNEASPEVSPFTSKFDYYKAGKAQLTPRELNGMALFNGKAKCSECHSSQGSQPLFTDYTATNLGIPNNPGIPRGPRNPDLGVGGFLKNPAQNPNAEWSKYADSFTGAFQVATARNVDKRPYPDFVKAYMHNGYLKSLKEVVHFYNTRDALPRCSQGDPGEKVTCWPPPAVALNMNTTQLGHLGLSSQEEDDIIAFLKTLTDGYKPAAR